ncbi:MAG: HD domain-containing protein [Clostridiales bacterium]|nr:HD domain-containing protein [Clostridiales bacterium]
MSLCTVYCSRVGGTIVIGDNSVPLTSFTGVFSNVSNLCIIFLVVFFKKPGFITSLVITCLQMPLVIHAVFVTGNMSNLPGIFFNGFTIIAIILIYRMNSYADKYRNVEIVHLREQQKLSQRLFEQTATALVNAIDAKDKYSHGHSMRVAEYSRKIARTMGKNEEECDKIYYAALLHDVGKIGIKNDIINKNGKLTSEEYEVIKQHPVLGDQILSGISEYPYLSIGARYHHERYDGKGYPDKLKGEDIPEIARIIAVADAYDAMTSTRSYRKTLPQPLVREEIVKNAGTQFDPKVAKIMQHLIDLDTEYEMKERVSVHELAGKNELLCGESRSEVSDGILITRNITTIRLKSKPAGSREEGGIPSLILFDSIDGRVHSEENTIRDLYYYEFGEIRFDGRTTCSGARKIRTDHTEDENGGRKVTAGNGSKEVQYVVDIVRFKDHAHIRIDNGNGAFEVTVAMPDNARFLYASLTGEQCKITDVDINRADEKIGEGYITRIAEEVSYIDGPSGDIPNLQVDGFRLAATDGIPVTGDMKIRFHARSMPTARLIWHCPFFDIFHSSDGKVQGDDYRDYALVRLDGENWTGNGEADNALTVTKTEDFIDWDHWKKTNKDGYDCEISLERKGNVIIANTENDGISIRNITTVLDGMEDIYIALTGDQCALTNIRIERL